ncbi:MAG: protein kinase family protein [Sulfobacillus sp.]
MCRELAMSLERPLAEGSYGQVYSTVDAGVVVKRSKSRIGLDPFDGCLNNGNYACTLSSGLVGIALNSLDSDYFPKYFGLYVCDGRLYEVIEKINGATYTSLHRQLSPLEKGVLLFHLVHALAIAQDALKFNHNDLIGNNVMLVRQDAGDTESITYRGTFFELPRIRYRVVITDFGFSRLTYAGHQVCNPEMRRKYYPDQPCVPYSPSVDLCKIIGNPNMQSPYADFSQFIGCRYYQSPPYPVIPPFPDFTAGEVLLGAFSKFVRNN